MLFVHIWLKLNFLRNFANYSLDEGVAVKTLLDLLVPALLHKLTTLLFLQNVMHEHLLVLGLHSFTPCQVQVLSCQFRFVKLFP